MHERKDILKKNNPLVSIVICCYNRAHLLAQTMESVFEQRYHPVEIIVIDDGSTDKTAEVMKSYGDPIRYFRQTNQGIAVARTVGCQIAEGEYIAFQDDDDLMAPNRISDLLEALKKHPETVFAVGDWTEIDLTGKITNPKSRFPINDTGIEINGTPILLEDGYESVLWPKITPLPHSTLFRKRDAERIGWFDSNFFHACSDTDFFARLGKLGPIVYVPKVVTYYRQGHSSIWKNKILTVCSRIQLFEKHMSNSCKKNNKLYRRLQKRILHTLKESTLYVNQKNGNEDVLKDYMQRGVYLLNLRDRFSYRLYKFFVCTLRRSMYIWV